MRWFRLLLNACPLLGAAAAVCFAMAPLRASAETVAESHAALVKGYVEELADLAEWCEEQKLPEQAQLSRNWLPPERPLTLFVPLVTHDVGERAERGEETAAVRPWRERFERLRREQAQRLFALLDQTLDEKQYALGFALLHETLREDPEHEAARRLLGYKQHEGRWLTPFELNKAQANQVWDPRFGWIAKSNLERYEKGERLFKGRWISAADDARLHAEIDRGWEVMTEHYRVRTNHSLEEGVRLAARLEKLYDAWRQVFVRFYLSDAELAKLLRGGGWPRRTPVRHQATYFRDRSEYNETLKPRQPNIEITTGYYEGDKRTAYFFAGEEQDDSSLNHEATHQLFSETRKVSPNIGREANFWIVEGVACTMESLVEAGTYCTIGGVDAIRLDNARVRLLLDDFYVPLAELTAMGMEDVQRDDRIKQLYSQFSGLTYFFMFDQAGRFRDALVDYLSAVYAGRDRPATLAELTETTLEDLDRQYKQFIERMKDEG